MENNPTTSVWPIRLSVTSGRGEAPTRALILWPLYCIWLNSCPIPSFEHWHWPKHQQRSPRYRWQHCLVLLSSCVTSEKQGAEGHEVQWKVLRNKAIFLCRWMDWPFFAFCSRCSVSCRVSSAALTCMTGLVIWKRALIHLRPGASHEFNPVTRANSGMWTKRPTTWLETHTHTHTTAAKIMG